MLRFLLVASLATLTFAFSSPQDPVVSLRDDGRAGTVVDVQGTALVRPVGRSRWTPLRADSLVMPGDQLRTPVRGANAMELRLAGGGGLLLGPGALIEVTADAVQLLRGDLEVQGRERAAIRVTGAGGFERRITDSVVLRGGGDSVGVLSAAPRWLSGYRSSTTDEWMGSLITNVDGRDVPLSVGYHHVEAVIRDQIAQTTVEQSFVNATKRRLEGVFYFPLPADASISGFGMWIGGELVEADIVEKQRARAIYETILRERRDPGLLEWSGGNLFKARVFPIEPHSEKRIRIRYTQVLPLEGSRVRYRYALRSELLRQRPLRDLKIKVNVASTQPLAGIQSPTHPVRARKTAHSATLEFDAEEYTPERDFEAVVELFGSQPLTVVPHRRGEDGYFMLLLAPPDASRGGLRRDLVPERGPLDVIVMADTSGSMDAAARRAQVDFMGGLLGLLGPDDRFSLMAFDVDAQWFRPEPAAIDEASVEGAQAFLERRPSLGWTDLDLAMASVLDRVRDGTVVIYVGDGIGTTGDADPVALAQRVRRLNGRGGVFHAVSTASTYESGVLEAIASLGGGSVRAVDQEPARAAFDLVAEAAQPAVKDLQIEFVGLRTARVYPEQLPNLSAGTQQVVLGRFLPKGSGTQRGQVIVTGTLDGSPVRYTADVEIGEDEAGNSFLPRLWARRHLDALLAKGRGAAIQEEIVSFSREFDIMTPYTSFLVLESDEDRQRFGVERRVAMRDGEKFFAEGHDRAAADLLRQHMQTARSWRLRLRVRMLREIAMLGRDLHGWSVGYGNVYGGRANGDYDGREGGAKLRDLSRGWDQHAAADPGDHYDDRNEVSDAPDAAAPAGEPAPVVESERLEMDEALAPKEEKAKRSSELGRFANSPARQGSRRQLGQSFRSRKDAIAGNLRGPWWGNTPFRQFGFPDLHVAPAAPAATPDPAWDPEVIALLRSLDRRPALARMSAALHIELDGGSLHVLRGGRVNRSRTSTLFSAVEWYSRTTPRGGQVTEHWLVGDSRGALAVGPRLGRLRPVTPEDRAQWPAPSPDPSMSDLVQSYRTYDARIASRDGGRVTVVLSAPAPQDYQVQLTIDSERHVVLESRSMNKGVVSQTTVFGRHERVAGLWWPTQIDRSDTEGRPIWRSVQRVRAVPMAEFRAELRDRTASHVDVVFIPAVDSDLASAKQAVAERKAGVAQHLRVAVHYQATQQWDKTWQAWDGAAEAVRGKPGADWIRARLLQQSRRGEELQALASRLAAAIAGDAADAAAEFRAHQLYGIAAGALAPDELLGLWRQLRPVFARAGEDAAWRLLAWQRVQAQLLQQRGRMAEARDLLATVVAGHPHDVQLLLQYFNVLVQTGDLDVAIATAEKTLAETSKWLDHEANQIFMRWTDAMWQLHQIEDLVGVLERWLERDPPNEQAYIRYLSVLLYRQREADVDQWIRARFVADYDPEDAVQRAKLGAAINLALGQGWGFYSRYVDQKWHRPLAELARRLATTEKSHWSLAQRIVSNHHFRRTDEYRTLRLSLLADLRDELESMELQRLGRYLSWLSWARTDVDEQLWRRVVDQLVQRWNKSAVGDRANLASHVLRLLDAHGETAEAIAFQRRRLREEDANLRPGVARDLMPRLVAQPWSSELEAELFALVPLLHRAEMAAADWEQELSSAYRWLADRLYQLRKESLLGPVAELETLARAERRQREIEARVGARKALVASFAAQARAAEQPARRWLEIERLCFAVEIGDGLADIFGEAAETLATVADTDRSGMARVFRERAACVMAYAATRRDAPEGLGDRVMALLRDRESRQPRTLDWRYQIFRLLVTLDRPEELRRALQAWIVPAEVESHWRVALGYLEAELGRLREATTVFERVVATDELGPRELRALADWYLVLGETERRERAQLAEYEAMSSNQLSQLVYRQLQKLAQPGGALPSALDPEMLLAMRALLRSATHPAQYVSQVRSVYQRVKDFRLLESLADGLLGHSPASVYPFLSQVHGILGEVHEEATCDALADRIAALASSAESPTDRRALLLMQALVLRRSCEVKNQPGQYLERVLEPLRTAFGESWLPGERRLMADFLASMGAIPIEPLAREQLRQLNELHRLETEPRDRLHIAYRLYSTRWSYRDHAAAVDGLSAALDEYREKREGHLPADANEAVAALVSWLHARQSFAAAERFLLAESERQSTASQLAWYQDRLFETYIGCVRQRGVLSLGRDAELYRAVRSVMVEALWRCEPSRVYTVLQSVCTLHRAAYRDAGRSEAGADLARFASKEFPEVLSRMRQNQPQAASTLASALSEIDQAPAALTMLVVYLETEPRWRLRVHNGGFRNFGWELGRLRAVVKPSGALERRLLALVLRELRHHLMTADHQNSGIFHRGYGHFWEEKAGAFAEVARDVVRRSSDQPVRLVFAARYLWHGLALKDEAIVALQAAVRRGVLDEDGRWQLVSWLVELQRNDVALPLVASLVADRPDTLRYRTTQITVLHRLDRDADALALVAATEKRWRAQDAWHENAIAALAQTCLNCKLHAESVRYYEEVIPLHQRTQPNRGVGNGTLSSFYAGLARAHSGLGQDDAAVDAAAAAVVSWGRNLGNRQSAIQSLRHVLERIDDLDAYVARRDAVVAESGLDAPVVRKLLGQVYLGRKQSERALAQLTLARQLQPTDAEIDQAILQAHDQRGDAEGACRSLLAAIEARPFELTLVHDLARRLGVLGRRAEAERAWAGLVELQPNEAEGHRLLAAHREQQRRFDAAITQWQQVVRIRTDEPDGWFSLAQAQLHDRQYDAARRTLDHLQKTEWEDRFGDVRRKAGRMLRSLPVQPPR